MANPVEDRSLLSSKAITPSDTATVQEGRYLAIVCTVAGNVKITLLNGDTFTFPVAVGFTLVPYKVTQVWVTNTTATATFANQD